MKVIVVTDRKQAGPDFIPRMEAVAMSRPDAVMLREKDLEEDDFEILADLVGMSCDTYGVPLAINSFSETARARGLRLHLPLDVLRHERDTLKGMEYGASVHSVEDLDEAISLGARWVVFGNVFETTCKPGKAAAGTDLLKRICERSTVPVYAIGGITPKNAAQCRDAGAEGICVMSPFMLTDDPADLMGRFRLALQ